MMVGGVKVGGVEVRSSEKEAEPGAGGIGLLVAE